MVMVSFFFWHDSAWRTVVDLIDRNPLAKTVKKQINNLVGSVTHNNVFTVLPLKLCKLDRSPLTKLEFPFPHIKLYFSLVILIEREHPCYFSPWDKKKCIKKFQNIWRHTCLFYYHTEYMNLKQYLYKEEQ